MTEKIINIDESIAFQNFLEIFKKENFSDVGRLTKDTSPIFTNEINPINQQATIDKICSQKRVRIQELTMLPHVANNPASLFSHASKSPISHPEAKIEPPTSSSKKL